jgi:hypothetical protein
MVYGHHLAGAQQAGGHRQNARAAAV